MPYLLDLFRVPGDTFQLFLASGVINSRFGTLVAAMHTITIALLGTCAVTGVVRWRPAAIARYAGLTVALLLYSRMGVTDPWALAGVSLALGIAGVNASRAVVRSLVPAIQRMLLAVLKIPVDEPNDNREHRNADAD